MRAPSHHGPLKKAFLLSSIIVVTTTLIVATCFFYTEWRSNARRTPRTATLSFKQPAPGMPATPMIMPAFQMPSLELADQADLKDDSPVVGVCVGSQARAYSLEGMSGPATHVINDYFGNTPVTVAYCDLSDCARVFSLDDRDGPLNLRVAGWMGDQMGVAVGDDFYTLDSPDIPLSDFDFVRTTWGAWKQRFPETQVFIGGNDAKFGRVEVNNQAIDRYPTG